VKPFDKIAKHIVIVTATIPCVG